MYSKNLFLIILLCSSMVFAGEYENLIGTKWSRDIIDGHEVLTTTGLDEKGSEKKLHFVVLTRENDNWYVWMNEKDAETEKVILVDMKSIEDKERILIPIVGYCQINYRPSRNIIAFAQAGENVNSTWYTNIKYAWIANVITNKLELVNSKDVRCEDVAATM